MPATNWLPVGDNCHGTLFIVKDGSIVLVQKAPMDVGAVAGAVRFGDRVEADAMAKAKGDRMGELARDHGVIGGAHSAGRRTVTSNC